MPWVAINGIPLVFTGKRWMDDTIPGSFLVLFPIFLGFAIQRHRLLDIDALFAGSFVYVLTLAALGVVDLGMLSLFGSGFGKSLALEPTGERTAVVAMTALLDKGSGKSPDDILGALETSVREALRPAKLVWVRERSGADARGEGARDADATLRALDAAAGDKNAPVSIWEVPEARAAVEDPELYVALAVRSEGRARAALLLGELPDRRFYSRRDLASLEALGRQASILFDNARLFEENVRQYRAGLDRERRHLAERESILRELHDGLGSITTGIVLLADAGKYAASAEEAKVTLGTICSLSRESLVEIRGFMQHLDAPHEDLAALVRGLARLGERVLGPLGIVYEARLDEGDASRRLGNLVAFHLFRVVSASATGDRLSVRVTDDGVGIRSSLSSRAPREGGRGLANMRTRAELLGGAL
ncbi:hypothetical protein EON77_13250, partial [bacterium]